MSNRLLHVIHHLRHSVIICGLTPDSRLNRCFPFEEWELREAISVTNEGLIAGWATNREGSAHALFLRPVPGTSTWGAFSLTAVTVDQWRRRRLVNRKPA